MRTFNELLALITLAIGKLSDTGLQVQINQVSGNMVELQTETYQSLGFVLITADKITGDVAMHFMPTGVITNTTAVADIAVSAEDLPENKGQMQITQFIQDIHTAMVQA